MNWEKCPLCGSEEFSVRTQERILGSNPLQLLVDNGKLVAAEFGLTTAHWGSSITTAYFSDCCGDDLPEEYQGALDKLLPNQREPEE